MCGCRCEGLLGFLAHFIWLGFIQVSGEACFSLAKHTEGMPSEGFEEIPYAYGDK